MDEIDEYNREITRLLGEEFINYFLNNGVLTEVDIRNIKIRYDFKRLLEEGATKSKAIKNLSQQFHYTSKGSKYTLSIGTIERITRSINFPKTHPSITNHNITNSK
jgi:uncharacterized protein YerC